MVYPVDAVVAVTYKCQTRCRVCSIWKIKAHNDIPPEVYKKLPATLKDINITGGEPFLREDLADIVRIVHERLPSSRMVVSSNGYLGKKLIPRALELKKISPTIGFGFSIDGIGKMHDFMRGVNGSYEKVLTAVKGLREKGVRNLRIAYTLTKDNSAHMIKVYELSKELDIQFTMQVSHDSDFYFGIHESAIVREEPSYCRNESIRRDFEKIINGELSSYNLKRWGKAFVFYGIYKLAAEGRQLFSSRPGVDFFYLDPKGDIYPSVIHNYVMGNLTENDFNTIWESKKSDESRKKCREDKRPYWMGCMLRKALFDHRFQIGLWAIRNKFFGLKL
jgi:MoaA/NifB/PqqE/SkfB family radical SAM enzyme